MDQKTKIHSELRKNEFYIREKFENCADILIRPMRLGSESKIDCLMVYIEVAVSNMMLDDSALGKMINHFWEISPGQIQEFMRNNSLGIADVQKLADMEEVLSAVFAGNAVFFIDGYDRAMKISSKGYPNMGVSEAESEKVLRGSKEGFSDSVKTNSALVRKRIRDSRMKVEEYQSGVRSNTTIQILYIEDLVAVLPTGWYDTIHTAELTGKEIRELEQEGFHLCSDYLWIYGRWRCFFRKIPE